MRIVPLLFCILFTFSGFAQDSLAHHEGRRLMSIKFFRSKGIPLTKQDSLDWVFFKKDTLIPIERSAFERVNGIEVLYEPRDEEFLSMYKEAVFGHTEELQEKSTIKIWKEGIRLFFDPSVPESHRTALLQFSETVSAGIDSLKITEVQERAKSNLLIFYRHSEEDFDQEPRISNTNNSGFYLNWNKRSQINRGVVKINTYKAPQRKDQLELLKYQFFKTLGYFYYSPQIPCEGYLSECPVRRTITSEDLEILKYHYSYGMCKGINMKNFEEIHRNSKNTLREHPDALIYLVHEN